MTKSMVFKYMTKHDLILIIILIAGSIFGMGFMTKVGTNFDNRYVVIKVDGEEVKKISIDKSSESKKYEFSFNGTEGYIETKDTRVRMLPMDRSVCPQGICSGTGWIEKGFESIVCLPNLITVEFIDKSDDDIDLISH